VITGTPVGWYTNTAGQLVRIGAGTELDIDGLADGIILDADADTTISSPTDDQIDFEVGGSDVMTLTAAGLALASGSRVDDIDTVPADDDTALATSGAVYDVDQAAKNASNLASGTVPTARLGSGSASSSTFLRGDQSWAAALTLIASTTLGTDGTITFNSIPATYASLFVTASVRGKRASTVENLALQINSDSGGNYDRHYHQVTNTTVAAGPTLAAASIIMANIEANNSTANAFTNIAFWIPNYRSGVWKGVSCMSQSRGDGTAANTSICAWHGVWRNTAAITSLYFFGLNTTNLATGSIISLYGV
jgi:hypothetical protein